MSLQETIIDLRARNARLEAVVRALCRHRSVQETVEDIRFTAAELRETEDIWLADYYAANANALDALVEGDVAPAPPRCW